VVGNRDDAWSANSSCTNKANAPAMQAEAIDVPLFVTRAASSERITAAVTAPTAAILLKPIGPTSVARGGGGEGEGELLGTAASLKEAPRSLRRLRARQNQVKKSPWPQRPEEDDKCIAHREPAVP